MKPFLFLLVTCFLAGSAPAQITPLEYKLQLNNHLGFLESYQMVISAPMPVVGDSAHLNRKPFIKWLDRLYETYPDLIVNETLRQIDQWRESADPYDTTTLSYQKMVSHAVLELLGFDVSVLLNRFPPINPNSQKDINQLKRVFQIGFQENFLQNGKINFSEIKDSDKETFPVPVTLIRIKTLLQQETAEPEQPAQATTDESPESDEKDQSAETETEESPVKEEKVSPPPSEPDPF